MPDVPGLLHPGHPESPDDRSEQPGDGQEHPARVRLHPLHGTYRHIVAPVPLTLRVPHRLLSSLCAIVTDSIYQALSCRAHKYSPEELTPKGQHSVHVSSPNKTSKVQCNPLYQVFLASLERRTACCDHTGQVKPPNLELECFDPDSWRFISV